MLHRIPVSLDGLRGNHGLTTATHSGGNHDGQALAGLLKDFLNGHECSFGIERIKNRFHQQQIYAARDERTHFVNVSGLHLVKGADAKARVIRVRRVGERHRQRSDGPGHETRTARFVGNAIGPFATLARGLFVDFPCQVVEERILDYALIKRWIFAPAMLARVVHEKFALADAGGGKGVGLDDIGASLQKAAVDVANRARLRQGIEVAIVLQILLGILEPLAPDLCLAQPVGADGGAHRAVNDDDAFAQGTVQEFGVVRHQIKIGKTALKANEKSTHLDAMICNKSVTIVHSS